MVLEIDLSFLQSDSDSGFFLEHIKIQYFVLGSILLSIGVFLVGFLSFLQVSFVLEASLVDVICSAELFVVKALHEVLMQKL